MNSRTIAICDQNQLFREGLRSLLAHSQFTVFDAAEALDDLAGQVDPSRKPALIIYGLDRDDELPAEVRRYHAGMPASAKLVLLANTPTADLLRAAAEAGVHAVLSRNISGEVLQRALEYVLLGQRLFPAPQTTVSVGNQIGIEPPPTSLRATPSYERSRLIERTVQLSEREAQILGCLVEGAPNKQIARDLGITEATVKVHIKGLLRKLRVSNRTQAAVWGLHNPYATDPYATDPASSDQTLIRPISSPLLGMEDLSVALHIDS